MKLERLRDNKKIIYAVIVGLLLILTVTLFVSRAKFRITSSIPIAEGVVKYTPYDFKIEEMYVEDINGTVEYNGKKYVELTDRMPESGYTINSGSYCYIGDKNNKDSEANIYTNDNGEHIIANVKKNSNCIIYFDKTGKTMEELLATYYTDKRERITANKDFNVPFTEETTKVVYSAPDDDGTSYYFAGNPSDNWVEFGGYYWRIIRINGDKSIRMIYQGRTEDESGNKLEPQTTGVGINGNLLYKFNNNGYNNNAYVGYWYQLGVLRGLQTPSNAYTELNNWFESSNTKQGSTYFNLIDLDAGFCGDRQPSTSNTSINGGGGTGTTTTYYGAYVRLAPGGQAVTASTQTVTPTLNCASNDDLYTYTGAKAGQGNHKLANPVGMITADEVSYAGMAYGTSSSGNYLDIGDNYWVMSPLEYGSRGARMFIVNSKLSFPSFNVKDNRCVIRPVINLRSSVKLSGSGTQSDPYKVIP